MRAQVIQEIGKKYELDKYEKNDFTKALFKDFIKYGRKLIEISSFEEMVAKGKPITPENQELISKKNFYQNHLDSLKFALDAYAKFLEKTKSTVSPKENVTSLKVDPEQERKIHKQEIIEECSQNIATLLSVGNLLANENKCPPTLFASSALSNTQVRFCLLEIVKTLTSTKENEETTLEKQINKHKSIIQKFLMSSSEEIDNSEGKLSYSEVVQILKEIQKSPGTMQLKFSLAKQNESNLQPPGLSLDSKIPQKKEMINAVVSTYDTQSEEGDLPPDPSQRMPVSVLVGNITAEPQEEKKEIETNVQENDNAFAYSRGEPGTYRPRRRYQYQEGGQGRYRSGRRRGEFRIWRKTDK